MEKIKSVAVLGAGAMGAYFATRFFASEAIDITLVARDQRYQSSVRVRLDCSFKP